jgi:hypothetical protein
VRTRRSVSFKNHTDSPQVTVTKSGQLETITSG